MYDPDAQYDDEFDYGQYAPPPAGQVSTAPAQRKQYSWWSDPDTDPPDWMLNPATPPIRAGGGQYWNWAGDHWEQRQSPTATNQTTPTAPPPPSPYTPGGDYHLPERTNLTADGSGPDYSQLLPFSPYREYGPFQPRNDTFEFEPFSYAPFTPSSYDELEKQPGFSEGQDRLRKQIEAGVAYKGTLRSGMTLGDLWTGLDTNKAQRFAEYDSRRFRDYSANRGNAFDAWSANLGASRNKFLDEYGIDKDRYSFGAAENQNFNNYRFNTERESFADALARWQEQVRSLTNIATAGRDT